MSRKKQPPDKPQNEAPDYLASFIINAGKVKFETADGRKWQMRQPRPEEAADGDSAYRIAYNKTLDNARLLDVADGDRAALEREARKRGSGAEAAYMLPLLLEDERGHPVFDVFDPDSMREYEETVPAVVAEMTMIYFGPLLDAINEAKKKLP